MVTVGWTVVVKCAPRISLAGSARAKANAKTVYANACPDLAGTLVMYTTVKLLPMVRPAGVMDFATKKEPVSAMLAGLMQLARLAFVIWESAIKYAVAEVYVKRLLASVMMNSLVVSVI